MSVYALFEPVFWWCHTIHHTWNHIFIKNAYSIYWYHQQELVQAKFISVQILFLITQVYNIHQCYWSYITAYSYSPFLVSVSLFTYYDLTARDEKKLTLTVLELSTAAAVFISMMSCLLDGVGWGPGWGFPTMFLFVSNTI